MRKLLIACGFLFVMAAVASAQETRGFEVAGDYQYVRFNPGNGASGINCQGAAGSFGAYLTAHVGIIGELGGCKVTGLPSGTSEHQLSYLVGPRLYFRPQGRVFPFVQALVGGDRFSAGFSGVGTASSSAFAVAAGGGADVTLTRHVSLRAVQVDYLLTRFNGASQNNVRLQTGLVWRFDR